MTPRRDERAARPPRGALQLLRRLLHPEDREPALADLAEEFDERCIQDGEQSARQWYRRQAARSVVPAIRRRWVSAFARLGFRLPSELAWAWRGVTARRGAGLLVAGLLAVALAANSVLFAVTDALILRRFPFADSGRIVGFTRVQGTVRSGWLVQREGLDALRARTDLFSDVHGYYAGRIAFLVGSDQPLEVRYTYITPGLVEMLGVLPRWGRPLTEADAADTTTRTALIAEDLAREWFGNPSAAVGSTIPTTDRPLVVVGVMPRGFRFPDNRQRIWRPLDLDGLASSGPGSSVIARLTTGRTAAEVTAAVAAMPAEVLRASSAPPGFVLEAGSPSLMRPAADQRRLLLLLLAGAGVLLLIAAGNVITVELSGANSRLQSQAIRSALGASRASLVRVALLESGCLMAAALVAAGGLTWTSLQVVASWLPADPIVSASANPVDFDSRAFAFMGVLAATVFLVVSVPLAVLASNRRPMEVMQRESRAVLGGRARLRTVLTIGQISIAVALLIGSLLLVRSYVALVRLDKGFDSTGVARIGVTLPPTTYASGAVTNALHDEILDRLRARPDVVAITTSAALDVNMTSGGQLEVDDGRPLGDEIWLSERHVDAAFFTTLGIAAARGRLLQPGDPSDVVVIADTLADRLWPGVDPLGRRFRSGPRAPWLTVIGTISRLRDTSFRPDRPRQEQPVYLPSDAGARRSAPPFARPPASVPSTFQPNAPASGPISRGFAFLVRLDPPTRLEEAVQAIRSIDAGFRLTTSWIDDSYAATFDDRELAARVMTSFSLVAFSVAIAGVYGVITLLVAGRTREIGIRMALGADRRDIGGLVVRSTLRLAAAGVAFGLALAAGSSRWIESQVFGVSPTDPATYAVVTVSVLAAALVAAWPPARRAVRIDPTIALKAE